MAFLPIPYIVCETYLGTSAHTEGFCRICGAASIFDCSSTIGLCLQCHFNCIQSFEVLQCGSHGVLFTSVLNFYPRHIPASALADRCSRLLEDLLSGIAWFGRCCLVTSQSAMATSLRTLPEEKSFDATEREQFSSMCKVYAFTKASDLICFGKEMAEIFTPYIIKSFQVLYRGVLSHHSSLLQSQEQVCYLLTGLYKPSQSHHENNMEREGMLHLCSTSVVYFSTHNSRLL